MIDESLEDNEPEQYFLSLIKELNFRVNTPEFKDVIKSMLHGYNISILKSDKYKIGDEIDKEKINKDFISLLFMNLYIIIRDSENKKYAEKVLNALDKVQTFVNEYKIINDETGEIYNVQDETKCLWKLL